MFRVTRAEEQAVRLIMRLASAERQLTLSQLAEAENLPEPTVAKLLGILRRAGIADAVRGRKGGYVLAEAPEDISAARVLRSISGEPSFGYPCRNEGSEVDCPRTSDCGLRPVWRHLHRRVDEVLESTSVADLLESEGRARDHLRTRWPLEQE